MTNPRPIAPVTAVSRNRSHPRYYVVTIDCPHCPGTHTHGSEDPSKPSGYRASHCGSSRGYFIAAAPAELAPAGGRPA